MGRKNDMKLLDSIKGPEDLNDLSVEQLTQLSDEVRQRLIDVISKTGGHIGAGLGVVELTVALLSRFDSPKDKILWDVGHQGYPWKVLTGRNDKLDTLRQEDGLSGFLRRDESEHDHFGAGHAGTSEAEIRSLRLQHAPRHGRLAIREPDEVHPIAF